jgi:hypothetical protein
MVVFILLVLLGYFLVYNWRLVFRFFNRPIISKGRFSSAIDNGPIEREGWSNNWLRIFKIADGAASPTERRHTGEFARIVQHSNILSICDFFIQTFCVGARLMGQNGPCMGGLTPHLSPSGGSPAAHNLAGPRLPKTQKCTGIVSGQRATAGARTFSFPNQLWGVGLEPRKRRREYATPPTFTCLLKSQHANRTACYLTNIQSMQQRDEC